ncbi:MAG: nucleoside kinase [Muribaculaceae bacterium]|nr:nucleoside kinase [Muribaculaceae bacterium]
MDLQIFCTNTNSYISCAAGESLLNVYGRISQQIGFTPICATVNNKTENLSFCLFANKMVEFMPVESPVGQRVYIRSLCMLLFAAVKRLLPDATLKIEHSISRGYYCRLIGVPTPVAPETVDSLRAAMQHLVSLDLPFTRFEKLRDDVIDIFAAENLTDKVLLLQTRHDLYADYYTMGDVADSYYGPLAPSTGCLATFNLIPYRDGMLLLGPDPAQPSVAATPVPQQKLFNAFTEYLRFNDITGVKNVGELNKAVEEHRTESLINVAEALHDKKISGIADEITERFRRGGARVVLIAGPSSSGKTTFTKRLAIYLLTNLLVPQMISLDNYFVDRSRTPRDETGDYDYESLYALDIDLFNDHLTRLINGETVELPVYDFETGTRRYKGDRIHLDDNSILLIEGIHGLNPELTHDIADPMKYKVYVSALTTLAIDNHNWVPTTDNRLLRRIIRDHKYRGTSPLETIRRWPSVRRGEEKWIFPYQENADSMFNSSLIFELGVMKQYGEELLRTVPHDTREYTEANRLLKFLSYFSPIPEKAIPPTSLLREFLGGSSFHY